MNKNNQLINYYQIKYSSKSKKTVNNSPFVNDKVFPLIIRKLTEEERVQLDLNTKLNLPQKLKINLPYNLRFNLKINKLKTIVDLRSRFPPIYDQGQIGSCTANALCGLIGYVHPGLFGSRLFLYYNERVLDNSVKYDCGAYLSDGIITLKQNGICLETLWPYTNHFSKKPSIICYIMALYSKIYNVYNISNTLESMKLFLTNGYPFVVGIVIYESFVTNMVATTGIVPMPNTNTEKFYGGHAIVCVGYNDTMTSNGTTGFWIMRNSWGKMWGDKGYFYLPYAYLTDDNLSSDLWTIGKI
jgi:C1A family cysteine protease